MTGPPSTPATDEVERWVVLQVSAVVVRDGRVMRVRVTADLVRPLVGIEGGGLTEVGMRDMWETTPDLAPMVGSEGPLSSFPGRAATEAVTDQDNTLPDKRRRRSPLEVTSTLSIFEVVLVLVIAGAVFIIWAMLLVLAFGV